MKNILLSIMSIAMLACNTCLAQDETGAKEKRIRKFQPECEQQSIGDLIRKKDKKKKPQKDFMALILPNISSNPTNGFVLGVGGSFAWFMGDKASTRVSSAPFTVAVTSKQQLISFVKPNIFLNDNKYFLQGDWRFYIYSQPTYGLGSNAPESGGVPSELHWEGQGGPDDSVSFDMKFNYIRFHQIVNRKIKGHLYAGIGYHLDRYYAIEDEKLKLDTTPVLSTPHYFYSDNYDYNTSDYTLSGLSLNFVFDSRDSQINPYEGYYFNLNYRYYFKFLGSDQDASHLLAEFRTYVGLSEKMPRHLIAFWLFGEFNLTGDMPYLTLPALGGDQRARSGRGYVNGRYRGKNIVYGEVEWRFPISQCSKILGGVVFVNATTTDYPLKGVGLFEHVQPAVGFGIRVMVNKYFRTNINLDFAIGTKSQGFYFSGQETF